MKTSPALFVLQSRNGLYLGNGWRLSIRDALLYTADHVEADKRSAYPLAINGARFIPTFPADDVPGFVAVDSPALHTRDEMRVILPAWNCSEPLPTAGKVLSIAFPPGADFPLIRVNLTGHKSTSGKTLFACHFYRKAA